MNKAFFSRKNESGSVLVLVIMILALLTIIGLTVSRNSSVEVLIANNAMYHQRTFYAAESGIVHAVNLVKQPFIEANGLRALAQATLDWDFALDGSYHEPARDPFEDEASYYDPYEDGWWYGSTWIDQARLGLTRYTVNIWNNADLGNHIDDADSLIWLQSDAIDAMGARSSLRVLLQGQTYDVIPYGYRAQAGAGAGKNYNATDSEAIGTFNRQYRGE
jgi:hypothetical protein